MRVITVATTEVNYGNIPKSGYIPHHEHHSDTEPEMMLKRPDSDYWEINPEWIEWGRTAYPEPIDELHEACGRGCYESYHRPRPETAENADYLANILSSEHFSVLGHGHITFYVDGVSRAMLLELERHSQRYHLNFSVLSQRYVDQHKVGVVIPPLFTDEEAVRLRQHHHESLEKYDAVYHDMRSRGASVKEARGAARAFLPEATETKFFVTASIRGWRAVIEQRATPAADEEIRLFALEVLRQLKEVAPNSVQDLTGELL
ncbi:FAD-dependent thymidylate synthase [Plantactinospora solaniradicis]|uniref:FAD-dependent thymidylate synthase n=1 Tax=Plantactinospora solaniradicis TaxID=1723736 RepID=A0ABW1KM18_9ACTN